MEGRFGQVGDRVIVIRPVGETGHPTLEIGKIMNHQYVEGRLSGAARITEQIVYVR